MNAPKLAFSIRETAAVIGVSPGYVRKLILRGRLHILSKGVVSAPSLAKYIAGAGVGDEADILRILAGWQGDGASSGERPTPPLRRTIPPVPARNTPPAPRRAAPVRPPSNGAEMLLRVGDVGTKEELQTIYRAARDGRGSTGGNP